MGIHGLFVFIQKRLDQRADDLSVAYNLPFGYPDRIQLDGAPTVFDDEMSFTVDSFEIVR